MAPAAVNPSTCGPEWVTRRSPVPCPWGQACPHHLWRTPRGSRTTRASSVGPLPPRPPTSSVVGRLVPVDRGTQQRLRLMNANKPKNLDKDGSWGVERECNSHPTGCAFHLAASVCVTSDLPLLLWWQFSMATAVAAHLASLRNGSQSPGVHTESSSPRVSCKGHGETLGGAHTGAGPCG